MNADVLSRVKTILVGMGEKSRKNLDMDGFFNSRFENHQLKNLLRSDPLYDDIKNFDMKIDLNKN